LEAGAGIRRGDTGLMVAECEAVGGVWEGGVGERRWWEVGSGGAGGQGVGWGWRLEGGIVQGGLRAGLSRQAAESGGAVRMAGRCREVGPRVGGGGWRGGLRRLPGGGRGWAGVAGFGWGAERGTRGGRDGIGGVGRAGQGGGRLVEVGMDGRGDMRDVWGGEEQPGGLLGRARGGGGGGPGLSAGGGRGGRVKGDGAGGYGGGLVARTLGGGGGRGGVGEGSVWETVGSALGG